MFPYDLDSGGDCPFDSLERTESDVSSSLENIRKNEGGLNKKRIQLNLCNVFSVLIFN